jgi:hypothetical protein
VLCEVFGQIVCSSSPMYETLALFYSSLYLIETYFNCFRTTLFHCLVSDTGRASVDVWICVSACGCPILMRVVHIGMPYHALWNRAVYTASVADAINFLVMMLIMCTSPFCDGGVDIGERLADVLVGRSMRNKVPPMRLWDFASQRSEASL